MKDCPVREVLIFAWLDDTVKGVQLFNSEG